jgi:hypothetical protein
VVDPAKPTGASATVTAIRNVIRTAQKDGRSEHRDGSVDNEQGRPSTLKIPSIGDVLKFSGIAGGVIYAGLFLSYRKYYSILGVRPEDVGVNNTFILVRSIGFILLAAVGAGVAIALTGWFNLAMKGPLSRRQIIHIFMVWFKFMLIVSAVAWIVDHRNIWLPALMGGVLGIACIAMARYTYSTRLDRLAVRAGLVVAVVIIMLVPVIVAIISAHTRADSVQKGNVTTPATILGIPLLDVSAENVMVSWICPDAQRPAIFKQSQDNVQQGFLVGETSASYYLRLIDKSRNPSKIVIVKLPQNCAFLTHEEP